MRLRAHIFDLIVWWLTPLGLIWWLCGSPGAVAFKGATAYEAQLGRVYVRWTHLSGAHWRGRPWRRFSIQWTRPDGSLS